MIIYIKIFWWYGLRCKGKDFEIVEKIDGCKCVIVLFILFVIIFNYKDLNCVVVVKVIVMFIVLFEYLKLWLYICKYILIMGFFLFIVNYFFGENVNISVVKYVLR